MNNPFEKTNQLVDALNMHRIEGNIKVRLASELEKPDYVFYSANNSTLKSIANGIQHTLQRRPTIYALNLNQGYHLQISHSDMNELCQKLKLNFASIHNELKLNSAYFSVMKTDTTQTPTPGKKI